MTRALLLAVLVACTPAHADDGAVLTGTLKAIRDRGAIRIGVRTDALPFAFTNPGGQPVGFSVDLCHGIAEDVATTLNADLLEPEAPAWQQGVRIAYVPVAADARIAKVTSGEVDVECGSTTATAERGRAVAFSPIFFLAGTKLLALADAGITAPRDLAGKTVAVSAATTNADVMRALATRGPAFTILETPGTAAAYDAVATGRAAAMASDDILLAGLLAAHRDGPRLRIVGDYLSFEPYALLYRRDDPDFAALVTRSFARMAAAGALRRRYIRWFQDRLPNGESLNLPMGPQLTEMFRAMGEPD